MNTQTISGRMIVAILIVLMVFAIIVFSDTASTLQKKTQGTLLVTLEDISADGIRFTRKEDRGIISRDALYTMDDGSGSVIRLRKGSLLLKAPSRATILTRAARIDVLQGSVAVFADEESTTIAALKGPLLVTSQSSVIVPEAYQVTRMVTGLHDASLKRVPAFWLTEKLAHLGSSTAIASKLALRTVEEAHRDVATGSGTSLATFTALRLLLEPQDSGVTDDLVHVLATDRTTEQLAISILFSAETSSKPLPESLTALMVKNLKTMIVEHPFSTMSVIMPALHLVRNNLTEQGFPRSAKTWQSLEREMTSFALPLLTLDDRISLQLLLGSSSSSASSTGATVISAVPLHPRDSERMARSALLDAGILFMVDTSFSPVAERPGNVRVTNLFFSGTRDYSFDLTFDVTSQSVSQIILNGQRLPNVVPLPDFVRSL